MSPTQQIYLLSNSTLRVISGHCSSMKIEEKNEHRKQIDLANFKQK